jgi:hypothetical protein
MGTERDDWSRAGFHLVNGKLERIENGTAATNLRPAKAKARKTRFLNDSAGEASELERHIGDGAVGTVQIQELAGKRFHVRVTAIRARLLDWDNLCEKYHVDLLRYASGKAFGDSPATTTIEVCQEKVEAGGREEVRIEVFEV